MRGMLTWLLVVLLGSAGWAEAVSLSTDDGLELEFGPDGGVRAVLLEGRRLAAEGGGVYLKDMAPGAELARMSYKSRAYEGVAAVGALEQVGENELRVTSSLTALKLRTITRYRAEEGYVRLDCDITNEAEKERAIIAYFRLPVDATGARWWRSLQESEAIEAGGRYLNPHMTHQAYRPWASISIFTAVTGLAGGKGGLSLVVPMDVPRWFRTTYEKPFGYQVEVELGLSPVTQKFPNQASFSLLLYRTDPRWGLRSTVERYHQLFPDFFVRRIERGGQWYFDHPQTPLETELEEPRTFGLRFKETYVWSNETTRRLGILTMKYTEPWCDHYYGDEEVMRLQAQDLPANDLWAPTGKSQPIRVQAQALLISGVRLRDGSLWGPNHSEFRNKQPTELSRVYGKNWPKVREVLGPEHTSAYGCRYPTNPDIQLPGMCRGKSVVEYEVHNQWGRKPSSPQDVYSGMYYDSTSGWWTGWHLSNFARDQFPYADFPLVFDHETGEVALLHGLSCIEFLRFLTERVRREGMVTMSNSGPSVFLNFCAPYLDMLGTGEGFVRGDYAGRWAIRSVAASKPLSYLKNPDVRESDFHECLPFAVYPGGPLAVDGWEQYRPLYARFVPILDRLDLAGWCPVPGAMVEEEAVFVERYGPEPGGDVLFVVHNRGETKWTGEVLLLRRDLQKRIPQWSGYGAVREMVEGVDLPIRPGEEASGVALEVPPGESRVLAVTPASAPSR